MGTFSYTNTFPNDANTKLLIHGDNRLDDAATNKTVTNNSVQLVSSPNKFGNGSMSFNGTNSFISVPTSTDFDFGSGDFTIDFWVNNNIDIHNNIQVITNPAGYFGRYQDDNNYIALNDYVTGLGFIELFVVTGGVTIADYVFHSGLYVKNTWNHIAIVRSTVTAIGFLNGVVQAKDENVPFGAQTIGALTAPLTIGKTTVFPPPTEFFNGFIQEFRVSKGIARWTSNFTPPTKQYSPLAVGGTLNPVKIKNLHVISGGTAGIVKLINDDSSQTTLIQETGTINTGKSFNYGSPGFMFKNGCYMNADTNVTQVEVSVDEVA